MTSAERNEVRRVAQASLDAHANCRRPTDGPCTCGDCAGWRAILCYVPTGTTDAQHVVDLTVTATGLRAQVESLRECLRGANEGRAAMATDMGVAMGDRDGNAAERDALAAQLAEVRAKLDAAPKVCAIHSYALEGPCMTCGAPWPGAEKALRQERVEGMEKMRRISRAVGCPNSVEEVVEAVAAIKADLASERETAASLRSEIAATCAEWNAARQSLASERAHLAACRTRIAGLEQAADERSAEVARLTARVAELEARPVFAGVSEGDLCVQMLMAADPSIDPGIALAMVNGVHRAKVRAVLARLKVTLVAPELLRRIPLTSPPAARPVFAGVSEEELALEYARAVDRIPGIRAVLARLEVSLVAPVDPEVVARRYHDHKESPVPEWPYAADHDINSPIGADHEQARLRATAAMRATLTAAGIPVTPEVGK